MIGGYAVRWYAWSNLMPSARAAHAGANRPFREMFQRGAFRAAIASARPVELQAGHDGGVLASTENSSLQLWEDGYGLAFAAELPDGFRVRRAAASIKFAARQDSIQKRPSPADYDLVTIGAVDELPHIALIADRDGPAAHLDAVVWDSDGPGGPPVDLRHVAARWCVGRQGAILRAARNMPRIKVAEREVIRPQGHVMRLPPAICALVDAELERRR